MARIPSSIASILVVLLLASQIAAQDADTDRPLFSGRPV